MPTIFIIQGPWILAGSTRKFKRFMEALGQDYNKGMGGTLRTQHVALTDLRKRILLLKWLQCL